MSNLEYDGRMIFLAERLETFVDGQKVCMFVCLQQVKHALAHLICEW